MTEHENSSHRRHPDNMVFSTLVRTVPLKSVHYSSNPQAVGLLTVAAVLSLIMWYLFSFLTLFMNKYTLDALNAEPFLFCEYIYLFIMANYLIRCLHGTLAVYKLCTTLALCQMLSRLNVLLRFFGDYPAVGISPLPLECHG